jgi:hypothetical protein
MDARVPDAQFNVLVAFPMIAALVSILFNNRRTNRTCRLPRDEIHAVNHQTRVEFAGMRADIVEIKGMIQACICKLDRMNACLARIEERLGRR